jgi:hypothetical protein
MSVEIDETRGNGKAVGIDDSLGATINAADLDNPVAFDRNIAKIGRQPAAIVNPGALNHHIVSHDVPP